MHVFSFIPDRLLLSRKYELIHYAGGSCLLSSALCYSSFTAPMVPMLTHTERCSSQLPICTLYCRACLLTNGLEERSKERVLSEPVSAVLLQQSEDMHRLRPCNRQWMNYFKMLWCSRCVWTAFEKKKLFCSINIQYEFKIQKAQWWSQLMVIYTLASV